MVDLEDTARSPPAAARCRVGHFKIASPARWSRARVVGDGALEKNWGRQLGGIVGYNARDRASSGRKEGRGREKSMFG